MSIKEVCMFSRFNQLRKWHLCSLLLLSVLLSSAASKAHSLNVASHQAKNAAAPQLTLDMPDWWNAPVAISKVRLKDQEISPGASIVATDDWPKYLSIEGINKSEKTISYIAYAIDFTIAGEKSLYRVRLQDGNFYASPGALTAPGGLRILKGQKHDIRFTNDARRCPSTLIGEINKRKDKILKVELFVESVGYADDTLWAFGSRLKRNKKTSVFENIEYGNVASKNNSPSTNLAKDFLPKGAAAKSQSGCCVVFLVIGPGSANPVTANLACSNCPPSAGGGTCLNPGMKQVNSLNGRGTSGIQMSGFQHC
jgi:hypothetical protein